MVRCVVESGDPVALMTEALILPVFAGQNGVERSEALDRVSTMLGGSLFAYLDAADFTGKVGQIHVLPTFGRSPAERIILCGLGSSASVTPESIRRAWGRAATAARDAGVRSAVSAPPPAVPGLDGFTALAAAAEGASLSLYRFDRYFGAARSEDRNAQTIGEIRFVARDGDLGEETAAVARGEAIAAGIALARDLVNEPASVLNPEQMEAEARRVAETEGLEIRVLGPEQMAADGMGALLAVGKGSANAPRLIHLIYRPATGGTGREIGLVGKCITFDTGGYSIKTYEGMLEMKGDMAGGAAVLGAMRALRAVNCPHVVHGVICAAENMISGEAFRPGDILTAMNGVTIEVLSTDAEGRLVLADGLVYTARQGATEMIDLATLTGAIVVALGEGTAGLFSNDDALATRISEAAGRAGERVWRMPLTEELESQIKGDIGDIKNTGGRQGGAITAALFLQHFREGRPWAHLDIAGCNRTGKSGPYTPKGATGWGVRTLLEYVGR